MRLTPGIGGIALMLCVGVGSALAQSSRPTDQNNPPADQKMQPSGPPAAEQTPVTGPRLPTQPPGMEADNAKPTMLQPEHAATAGNVGNVPGATRQTMPSTISAENAAQDDMAIIQMQLPLTPEQRRKIGASLACAKVAPAGIKADVTQSLPSGTTMEEFPAAALAAAPDVGRYKFVKLSDRVLIVDPIFWIVVGEIKQ